MAVKKAKVAPTVKPVKAAEKVEAPKTESVKTEDKAKTPAAVPAKTETKTEVKAETKKETKKAPVKKAVSAKRATKKAELTSTVYVQFSGKSYAQDELLKMAKDVWRYDLKQKVGDLNSVELYVKPEENTVYYVMNKEFTGSFLI